MGILSEILVNPTEPGEPPKKPAEREGSLLGQLLLQPSKPDDRSPGRFEVGDKRIVNPLNLPFTTGKGLLAGILSSPLVSTPIKGFTHPVTGNPIVDAILARDEEGFVDRFAEKLKEDIKGKPGSKISEFVGEAAPSFAVGGGLFMLGRAALTSVLAQSTPRIAAHFGSSLRTAERGVEIAGGSLGFGAGSGLETLMEEGKTGTDAFRAAAINTALGAGFETGITVLGKALFKSAREVDPTLTLERFGIGVDKGLRVLTPGTGAAAIRAIHQENTQILSSIRDNLRKAMEQRDAAKALLAREDFISRAQAWKARKAGFKLLTDAEKKITIERGRLSQVKALRKFLAEEPIFINMTRPIPRKLDGGEVERALTQLYVKVLETPEGGLRQAGATGLRFLQQAGRAESRVAQNRPENHRFLDGIRQEAAQLFGFKKVPRDGRYLIPLVEAFELGQIGGVRSYARRVGLDEDRAVQLIQKMDVENNPFFRDKFRRVEVNGAATAILPEEKTAMGTPGFFPQMLKPLSDGEIEARALRTYMESGMSELQARNAIANRLLTGSAEKAGPRSFDSQTWRREVKGSTQQKIRMGMPLEDDPLVALGQYLDGLERGYWWGREFGFTREAVDAYKERVLAVAEAEGADPAYIRGVMDEFLNYKYYPEAMRRLTQSVTSFQAATKLVYSVIPNTTQTVNTLMMFGIGNTAKGITQLVRDPKFRSGVGEAIGKYDSIFASIRRSYQDQSLPESLIDRFSDWVLKTTLFSSAEKMNRMVAAAAAIQSTRKDTALALTGRLRGSSYEASRRRLGAIGVNLDRIVRRAKEPFRRGEMTLDDAIKEGIEGGLGDAAFNAAKVTQFIPDITRRPLAWNHPMVRIATQFKTFALQQGRFMRDQVWAEAAKGNPEPLLYFLSIYPLAGDLAASAIGEVKGRKRIHDVHAADRYIDDLTQLGALGLVQSLATSARFDDTFGFAFGPTGSDINKLASGSMQYITSGRYTKLKRFVDRQPIVKATRDLIDLGHDIRAEGAERIAGVFSDRKGSEVAIPLDELRLPDAP